MLRTLALFGSLLSLLLLAGCPVDIGTGDDPPVDDDDHPPGPMHPDTFLVEDHPCFVAADVSNDLAVIVFEFACDAASVDGLEPGRIVMGVDDGGYLRRLQTVELDGFYATTTTGHATLSEAVTDVVIDETITFDSFRHQVDFTGRVLDQNPTEDGAEVLIKVERGTVDIDPELDLDVELGFLSLKAATATLTVDLGLDVQALMESGAAVTRADMIELDRIEHPFEVSVAMSKFVGSLDIVVRLGFRHEATGPTSSRFGFGGNGTVKMGDRWEKDGDTWTQIWEPSFSGQLAEQVVRGAGDHDGRLFVQIEAVLHFDKVDGSTFRYEPWVTTTSRSDCEGIQHSSAAGISGETTMELGFFDDGPRTEAYPDLAIEAARDDGTLPHPTPPEGCGDPVAPGECTPLTDLACGAEFGGDTSLGDATDTIDGYPCNVGNYDGPEMAWRFVPQSSGPVEIAFEDASPTEINHDLLILDGASGSCLSSECIAHGFNSVQFDAQAGHAYFVVVDGYFQEAGPFAATLTCD